MKFKNQDVHDLYIETLSWIDNLRISHNASGMGANIRVLLIRNSSSHSSLDVNALSGNNVFYETT